MTSMPPPPRPPGRWTSSRTTSGRSSWMTATADSTSAASPTTSRSGAWRSSSLRTPLRTRAWSSTTTIRSRLSCWFISLSCRRGHPEADLGARQTAGRPGPDRRTAPVPLEPPDDRAAHPVPVGGDRIEVEARTAVPDEHLDHSLTDLNVQRHRGRAVDHRVAQRLAGARGKGLDRGAGRVVPGGDDVDGHPVLVLHLAGNLAQRGSHRVPGGGPVGIQPLAQLALLCSGQPCHLVGVLGAGADERERLQHRVVQVGGDVGALRLPRSSGAFGAEVRSEERRVGKESRSRSSQNHHNSLLYTKYAAIHQSVMTDMES